MSIEEHTRVTTRLARIILNDIDSFGKIEYFFNGLSHIACTI
jgi:hypothetical protein